MSTSIAPHRRADPLESRCEVDRAASQRWVLEMLGLGAAHDGLIYARAKASGCLLQPSRLRTARSELERESRVVRVGTVANERGRACALWSLPPVQAPLWEALA